MVFEFCKKKCLAGVVFRRHEKKFLKGKKTCRAYYFHVKFFWIWFISFVKFSLWRRYIYIVLGVWDGGGGGGKRVGEKNKRKKVVQKET